MKFKIVSSVLSRWAGVWRWKRRSCPVYEEERRELPLRERRFFVSAPNLRARDRRNPATLFALCVQIDSWRFAAGVTARLDVTSA
jgi:hypothetical protein